MHFSAFSVVILLLFLPQILLACDLCQHSRKSMEFSLRGAAKNDEGCKYFVDPPRPFYPNLHANSTFTSIPEAYLTKMKQLVAQVSEMVVKDFPPEFKSAYEYPPYVYWGTAGRAAMSLRLYRDSGDSVWLHRAKDYIDAALQGTPAYVFNDTQFAFQKGRPGLISIAAVVYNELGQSERAQEFLHELDWTFDQVQQGDYYDWENGIAGLVYAAHYVNQYFEKTIIDVAKATKLLTFMFNDGLKYYNATTKAMQWEYYRNHFWTGMGSHGSGSAIYALLQSEELMKNETIRRYVLDTVDHYVALQTKEGQIPGDLIPDRTQWCHGIPGLLAPLGAAYRMTKDDRYLNAGVLGSKLISEIGILSKGMQFCHGVGGNVYMMLDFYKQTGDERVLSMAISIIMTALDTPQLTDPQQWESYDCLPDGMFVSSSIGMVLLFSDLVRNADNLQNVQMVSFHTSI